MRKETGCQMLKEQKYKPLDAQFPAASVREESNSNHKGLCLI